MSLAGWRGLLRHVVILDKSLSASLTLPPSDATFLWGALRHATGVGAHLGDGILWLGISPLAYVLSGARGRREILVTAGAVLAAAGLVSALKFLVHRQRPRLPDGKPSFYYTYDRYAFPSGHASRVFCIATIIGATHPAWSLPLGGLACWVALSRVMLGIHHVSDVLVGAAIGCGTGALALCLVPPL